MSDNTNGIELQENLSRLSRADTRGLKDEGTLVTATGTQPPAWAIKIVSLDSYNLYNVRQVNIYLTGADPVEVTGSNTKAYNLSESFTETGTVPEGTFAVMWRVGNNNVFHITP